MSIQVGTKVRVKNDYGKNIVGVTKYDTQYRGCVGVVSKSAFFLVVEFGREFDLGEYGMVTDGYFVPGELEIVTDE